MTEYTVLEFMADGTHRTEPFDEIEPAKARAAELTNSGIYSGATGRLLYRKYLGEELHRYNDRASFVTKLAGLATSGDRPIAAKHRKK